MANETRLKNLLEGLLDNISNIRQEVGEGQYCINVSGESESIRIFDDQMVIRYVGLYEQVVDIKIKMGRRR